MNRQFIVKMMKAKQMEYQALKEIMPECMVNRIENLENEFVVIAKEYFLSAMEDTGKASDTSQSASDTKVRKVTIE